MYWIFLCHILLNFVFISTNEDVDNQQVGAEARNNSDIKFKVVKKFPDHSHDDSNQEESDQMKTASKDNGVEEGNQIFQGVSEEKDKEEEHSSATNKHKIIDKIFQADKDEIFKAPLNQQLEKEMEEEETKKKEDMNNSKDANKHKTGDKIFNNINEDMEEEEDKEDPNDNKQIQNGDIKIFGSNTAEEDNQSMSEPAQEPEKVFNFSQHSDQSDIEEDEESVKEENADDSEEENGTEEESTNEEEADIEEEEEEDDDNMKEKVNWHKIVESNKNNTMMNLHLEGDLKQEDHTLNMTVMKNYDGFKEEVVPPLHLVCTAVELNDLFPVKGDMNFSKEFGIESEYFDLLQLYLDGKNVEGRNISLKFPVFMSVTPKSNNTVERSICLWISSFSSLVPPEMDRHLGFLEIPQPMDNRIEVYASGEHVKFTRSFTGDVSDWLYRKEVKTLMDDIIENGIGDITDFGSYMIEMFGASKHSVSFRKIVQHQH